jgi:hypothetical protein
MLRGTLGNDPLGELKLSEIRTISKRDFKALKYRGFAILKESTEPNYKCILNNTINQLDSLLSHYSDVFTFRIDLHFERAHEFGVNNTYDYQKLANEQVNEFFKRLGKKLKRSENNKDISTSLKGHKVMAYQWVYEVEELKQGHMHCWIALAHRKINKVGYFDSNDFSQSKGIIGLIQTIWADITEKTGHVYLPANPSYRVKRNDVSELRKAVYRYSYFSKNRGKQYGITGLKNHGSSRLKKLQIGKKIPQKAIPYNMT